MKDQSKTKQALIQELATLRQRVEELEQSESEWKKEKGELKRSESLFRSYFDLPLYGIAITSPEKGWITVNDRICSIMGYSRDEIVCKTWSEMTHPDDLAADAEQFSRVLSGKIDQYNMCKRFIRKDGEIIWTNLSVGCVRNSDSSVDYVVAMVEDITSVKLAEETLRQERMLYEDLVTTEPAGVYRLRVKLSGNWQAEPWSSIVKSMYSVDMASDRYCNILGISHEEFMTNAGLVRDLIHPADKQDFDVLNMEAITRLSPFTWEGRIIREHQTRWIHFESLPRELDSETVLWTGIVYDITERKRMEEALHVSEIKYRKLYQSMMDAYVSTDMEGYIRDYNESYINMLGYAPEEIIALTYKDITPEKWHMMEDAIIEKQVLTKGYSDIYEKEYRRKDGTTFPVELRSMLLRDTDGTPISMWAIVRDITERKKAEADLQASEAKYRLLFESVGEGITISQGERIRFANDAVVKLLGHPKDIITTRPFLSFTHPDDRAMVFERYSRRMKGEAVETNYSYRIITADGTEKWIHVFSKRISWEGAPAVMSFVIDITERRQTEEKLHEISKRLQLATASAKAGVWDWNLQTNEMIWDDRMLELYGLTRENFPGGFEAWEQGLHPCY